MSFPNKHLPILAKFAVDAFINPAMSTGNTGVSRGAFVNVTSAPDGTATALGDTGPFDNTT